MAFVPSRLFERRPQPLAGPPPTRLVARLQDLGARLLTGLVGVFTELFPKGLYARALIIIIAPIVLLEGVVAYIFMERHWQSVTRRLSEATARDVAALVEIYRGYEPRDDYRFLQLLARDKFGFPMQVLPAGDLPAAAPKPFFSLLDRTLSDEIRKQLKTLPFWIDTVGNSRHVEIKVRMPNAILSFVPTRSQTYASNSHIFLIWMVGSSVVLLSVAILFLRNQIKPILRLAEAAEAFGKGRPVPDDFRPRGAREVRSAALAFVEMRDRIIQHVDQRTAMLAGVSHDLRTVLTRFKLELAMLGDGPEIAALKADVNEMQHMLEDYLAFARGDGGETARPTNVSDLLTEIHEDAQVYDSDVQLKLSKRRRALVVPLKRQAMKRAVTNLVSNACRFGGVVTIRCVTERQWLRIEIEDNGPGIPEAERENVFKPFYRLDHARNQDKGNSGLGLAIARDISRSHGGDIALSDSTLGGLKAVIRVPL